MAVPATFSSPAKAQEPPKTKQSAKSDEPTYMITAHTVVHDGSTNSQLDNYVIVYRSEVLNVQYAESQLSTLKPGASLYDQTHPGKNLHRHARYGSWPQGPDVSQVPQIGVPIRVCEMDTNPLNKGAAVIAIQSVSAPCMARVGDILHYVLAPNGGVKDWEYVNFDVLEETNNVGVAAAPSNPKAPASAPPTIEQQEACRAQANTVLREQRNQWASPTYVIALSHVTSRFDAPTGTCYARTDFIISVKNKDGHDGVVLTTDLQDAFGGTVYASNMWDNSEGKKAWEVPYLIFCSVKPRGQAEITCKTTDEFMALLDKDFGL